MYTSGSHSGLYRPLGGVGITEGVLRGKGAAGELWRWAPSSALLAYLRLKRL
jgi:hypothetical protein